MYKRKLYILEMHHLNTIQSGTSQSMLLGVFNIYYLHVNCSRFFINPLTTQHLLYQWRPARRNQRSRSISVGLGQSLELSLLIPLRFLELTPLKINGWNPNSWRFGSDVLFKQVMFRFPTVSFPGCGGVLVDVTRSSKMLNL